MLPTSITFYSLRTSGISYLQWVRAIALFDLFVWPKQVTMNYNQEYRFHNQAKACQILLIL